MIENTIQSRLSKLSPRLQLELFRYIDFLAGQKETLKSINKKFNFEWEGALSEMKEEFSSVELQHKSLEWR